MLTAEFGDNTGSAANFSTQPGTEGDARRGGDENIPHDFQDCYRPTPEEMFDNRNNIGRKKVLVRVRTFDVDGKGREMHTYVVPLALDQPVVIQQ